MSCLRHFLFASCSIVFVLCCVCDADRLSATSTVQEPTGTYTETDKPTQQRNPRYQLSRGDTLELLFPFAAEFNQTVTVNPDGFVNLMEVGDLYIAGKTVLEAKDLLLIRYSRILHDPVVNLVLKDFERPYFIAGGELAHPGKFDLRGDLTLTEGIALAGGFTESSKHSQVLLFRRVSHDWAEVKVLNVKKMFQSGTLAEDVHLQPGDMVFVPQNRISKIKKWIPYTSVSTGATPKL